MVPMALIVTISISLMELLSSMFKLLVLAVVEDEVELNCQEEEEEVVHMVVLDYPFLLAIYLLGPMVEVELALSLVVMEILQIMVVVDVMVVLVGLQEFIETAILSFNLVVEVVEVETLMVGTVLMVA